MNFDLTEGVAVLERTPGTLRALLAGLPPAWTDATEGPETWSPYVIVGHLIHGERADWIPRARIILDQGPRRRFTPCGVAHNSMRVTTSLRLSATRGRRRERR